MKGYYRYFGKKLLWLAITFVFAIILNFLLPRLMPGDPVQAITGRAAAGITSQAAVQQIYRDYAEKFGTNKPIFEQFVAYIKNLFKGDFGVSFSQYPRPVVDIIKSSIVWTISLQFPAIIVGWLIGNILGALAAYIRKGFDKALLPLSIFISGVPPFGLATILLVVFAINLKLAPISGGYSFELLPSFTPKFIMSVISHYWLPFLSVLVVSIGGQAIGMRSMAIYELNADYVKYSRFMGITDKKIVSYVFRNAMLPQITGLAISIGTMMGGALVAEIIFAYPGLGFTMLNAVTGSDYPLISACTLIITLMVLSASFLIEVFYGLIDPRIKTTQAD